MTDIERFRVQDVDIDGIVSTYVQNHAGVSEDIVRNFINQYNDEQLRIAGQKIESGETIDNIKLKKLIDPTYGGDMPYYENSEYILTWIKNYYSIPQEVVIIYE